MNRTTKQSSRRPWLYLTYVVVWLVVSYLVGAPIISGLSGILAQMSVATRLVFYLMPPLLVGLLILGILQIISMYRYWFGPR